MSRTIIRCDLGIISGTLLFIKYDQRNWGAGGLSFKYAGQDLYCIIFTAWGGIAVLTRFSAVQEFLNILFTQRNTGRTSIYNNPESFSMGFSPGRDLKMFSIY